MRKKLGQLMDKMYGKPKTTLEIGNSQSSWNEYKVHPNGIYQVSVHAPQGPTKLPAGAYTVFTGQSGEVIFCSKTMECDKLLRLPDMATNVVLEDLKKFWSAESKYRYEQLGMIYKRGILMHGLPGTGKSAVAVTLAEEIINDGGIVLFNPSAGVVSEAVKQIRSVEGQGRNILVILEEVDTMCDDADFLSLLDGELQIDNIAYIATTNYIDRIPKRIKNRPSRFARVIEIGTPSLADRTLYIEAKAGKVLDKHTKKEIAKLTEGMVLDQVKDVIISTYVFNEKLEEAINKIKDMDLEEEEKEDSNLDKQQTNYLFDNELV